MAGIAEQWRNSPIRTLEFIILADHKGSRNFAGKKDSHKGSFYSTCSLVKLDFVDFLSGPLYERLGKSCVEQSFDVNLSVPDRPSKEVG